MKERNSLLADILLLQFFSYQFFGLYSRCGHDGWRPGPMAGAWYGDGPRPSDLGLMVRIRYNLFKREPTDKRWTSEIGWLAPTGFP